ncbi:MAG: hypothetical protein PF485_03290 [Bacteroidales bacterium]|jgi:hypothetical protein|nr:hypothetical protein [Bacteroidales bacterium]
MKKLVLRLELLIADYGKIGLDYKLFGKPGCVLEHVGLPICL